MRLPALACLCLTALALLLGVALAVEAATSADRGLVSRPLLPTTARPAAALDVGDPLPRIQCPAGYTATVYAEDLSSPDGLAFSPDGVLYVAEETAGRVSRVGAGGLVTPIMGGLANPEGIAFDEAGNLYVVEDVPGGRLIKRAIDGVTTTLATDRDAPEGVVWSADGSIYITESNAQFASDPPWDIETHVTTISPLGEVTRILTDVVTFSYAGITVGADGLLYVTNELSGPGNDGSVFWVDPLLGTPSLFARGLITPEGLRFAADGQFPLYVAEEDTGGGAGRLSRVQADGSHGPFCTGFENVEDVALDKDGRLYVSEDTSGLIIRIQPLYDVALAKIAEPPDGATVRPGERITYTLVLTNGGAADASGLVLTDTLPAGVSYVPGSASAAPGLNLLATPPPALVFTGTLPAGNALTATFRVTVSSVPSGTLLVNGAEAIATGSDLVTDTTTHGVTVVAPDLSIVKAATPASGSLVAPGGWMTYTVVVANEGGLAQDVTISDTLDLANVNLVISHTTAGWLSGPNPVRVTGFDLDAGQRVTLTLGVTVSGSVSGTAITNRASFTSTQTPSPQLSDDVTHVISGTGTPLPDWGLTKSADPPGGTPLTQGETITYTIVAYNGGGLATHVVLTDAIPAGTAYVAGSAAADPGSAGFDGTQVRVSLPGLPAGAVLTLTFRVTVTAHTTAAIVNTAWLASDQTEPETSNAVSHPVRGVGLYCVYLPIVVRR